MVQVAVGANEMRQREVAVASFDFGPRDGPVDMDVVVSGGGADEAQQLAQVFARGVVREDRVGDHDGAGIDEGISRDALLVFELEDRVEGEAGGFPPDPEPEPVAEPAEGEGEREDLRDALDRERHVGVADGMLAAIGEQHRYRETAGIDIGKLGDIVRDRPAILALADAFVDLAQDRGNIHQGRQDRKLAMSRSPVAWLFSGWNWVPTMLSLPTMAVIGPP